MARVTPGAEASPSACPDIDLRAPSGEPVDLTGTWHGDDDAYWVFVQVGDCVWATATDQYFDGYWQVSLRGTVRPDLTVPIEFVYAGNRILSGVRDFGHALLQIEIPPAGAETLRLRKIGGCNAAGNPECPPGETSLQTTLLTLVSTTVIVPPPTPGP